ncbi:MAG: hypothetical protein RRZ24_11440 [Clostridia bacterium]
MNKAEREKLIKEFKQNANVMLCGPDGSTHKNHLRLYAYGGCIGGIPLSDNAQIKLLDKNYQKHGSHKEYLRKVFDNCPPRSMARREYVNKLYRNSAFVEVCIDTAKDRFTTSRDEQKERANQTQIGRANMYTRHSGYFVCDVEYCCPYNNGEKKEHPKFDFVLLNTQTKEIVLVEYKCSKAACINENGISKHLTDMKACKQNNVDDIIKTQKHRFQRLLEAGVYTYLSPNCVDALDDERPFTVKYGFLFTDGEGIQSKEDVIRIAKSTIGEQDRPNTLMLYAHTPKEVDFNALEHWHYGWR